MKKLILLSILLIVGCMFAYNDEPKLKKHHWKLFWIEKEVKSIVKIDFIDEWCDCMNQCSQDIFDKNKISLGNMEMRVYIKECPSDKDSN